SMDTRTRLILTAERLFARHGIDGVSMRQIAAEAGQRNNYAAQYHFGGKEALVGAVFMHRVQATEERQAQLLAERHREGRGGDARPLVLCLIPPLVEIVAAPGAESHYLRFLVEAANFFPPAHYDAGAKAVPSYAETLRLLLALMEDEAQPLRSDRL